LPAAANRASNSRWLYGLRERALECRSSSGGGEHRLPEVAAIDHVVAGTGKLNANASRHAR